MESRTQGSRPRTQKKSEAKAKDSLSEDKHSRGQGQECSRPRPRTKDTSASALQNKKKGLHKFFSGDLQKKRSSQKFFKRSPQNNVFQKIFQPLHKILTIQKLVLSSSRGQANFRGLEASRPRPRTSKCVLEAKDVLEDSTSGTHEEATSSTAAAVVSHLERFWHTFVRFGNVQKAFLLRLWQGSATYGPQAKCGQSRHFTRPATFYFHPARDLFSFFHDRYAAINRRNYSHLIFWSLPWIRPKKGLSFWRRPIFLVWWNGDSPLEPC